MIQYQGYGDTKVFDTMEEFALARVKMDAPLLGGMTCPATEHTWAVIEDGKERNPTSEEKQELRLAVSRIGRDSGHESQ